MGSNALAGEASQKLLRILSERGRRLGMHRSSRDFNDRCQQINQVRVGNRHSHFLLFAHFCEIQCAGCKYVKAGRSCWWL